ncbi:MAG: SDR family NAD(P)-dependent oxidoreductase [Bacteroidetes bacterium]|nr:SDR family NAD(P)-dependent oxidoreductase [Bacteroidota bacterium]
MNFNERVILITGASSGIGRELALRFAKEKCRLILISRRLELLEALKEQIENYGSELLIIKCDVTKKDEVKKTVSLILEKFKRIDGAILNSGVGLKQSFANFDSSIGEQTFAVNFFGIVYFLNELLPILKKQRSGFIAGVSSLADARSFPVSGFYCSSKAAVTALLESLKAEYKPFNVKIISVHPGFIKTPMTDKNDFPMPYLMDVDKAVEIIFNGLKKGKEIIRFPWQMALLTGFLKRMPDSWFQKIASKSVKK